MHFIINVTQNQYNKDKKYKKLKLLKIIDILNTFYISEITN
jgi:hypothetical protein